MNYSRSIKRSDVGKRVTLLICIAVFIGLTVGVFGGYILKSHIAAKQDDQSDKSTNNIQAENKTIVYGAYDDRIVTHEISLDWDGAGLDFVPLQCDMPYEEQEFLFCLCSGYNIDFCLAMAVIQTESQFDADAVSATNDYGLMQINKMNHDWLTETLGVTDYLDPYQNIRAGMFVLRKLFERYQDTELVLMAYKMGENGASRLWDKNIFTTDYTQDVLNIQQQFIEQLESGRR